jgi:hypothetical protein
LAYNEIFFTSRCHVVLRAVVAASHLARRDNMPALANDTFGLPLAKRQKRAFDEKALGESRNGSKVFAPFRVR